YQSHEAIFHILVGAEAQDIRTSSHSYEADQPDAVGDNGQALYPNIPTNLQTVAGYAQGELTLYNKLLLIAGGRFDYNSIFHSAISPRGAIIYHPGEHSALKLIYGRGFRNASPFEQSFHDTTSEIQPEPLAAEKLDNLELVGEHTFGMGLSL